MAAATTAAATTAAMAAARTMAAHRCRSSWRILEEHGGNRRRWQQTKGGGTKIMDDGYDMLCCGWDQNFLFWRKTPSRPLSGASRRHCSTAMVTSRNC